MLGNWCNENMVWRKAAHSHSRLTKYGGVRDNPLTITTHACTQAQHGPANAYMAANSRQGEARATTRSHSDLPTLHGIAAEEGSHYKRIADQSTTKTGARQQLARATCTGNCASPHANQAVSKQCEQEAVASHGSRDQDAHCEIERG